MAWYRQGTVSVANGSTAVVGTLTGWTNQARPEDAITFDGGSTWHEIASVNNNTSITLAAPYAGTTVTGGAYAIQRLGRGHGLVTGLSVQVAALLAQIPALGGIGDALRVLRGNASGTAYELTDPTFGQVTVGTVTTLSPGASATVTNSGTPAAAVLNFGIPRGNSLDPSDLYATIGYRPALISGAAAFLGPEEGFSVCYLSRTAIVRDYRRPALLSVAGYPEDLLPCVRSTTATAVGRNRRMELVAANTQRYLHSPVNGVPMGGLMEGAGSNLSSFSEDVSDASWSKVNATIVPNVGGDQMGGTTADRVVPTATSSAVHSVKRANGTVAAGATVTQSVFLKAAGYNFVLLRVGNSAESDAFQVECNLAAGTVGTPGAYGSGAVATGARLVPAFGGSYRLELTGSVAGLTAYSVAAYVYNAAGAPTYSGDGTSGVEMWGFQHEVGAAATSYIPRLTSAAASRSGDAVAASLAALVASSEEGTLIVEAALLTDRATAIVAPAAAQLLGSAGEHVAAGRFVISPTSSSIDAFVGAGGTTQVDTANQAIVAGSIVRHAVSFSTNDVRVAHNGAIVATDTSATIPALSQFVLAASQASTAPVSGIAMAIRCVAFITRALTNAELQQRTA
jgi:hypothetical protein